MFFVKELNEETKGFIKTLEAKNFRQSHRVVAWVGWLNGDEQAAKEWTTENRLRLVYFSVVSADEPTLKAWNLPSVEGNAAILACRRRTTMATFANVRSDDIGRLEASISKFRRKD